MPSKREKATALKKQRKDERYKSESKRNPHRTRLALSSRHDRHARRVYACPRCNPTAPDAFRKEREEELHGKTDEANNPTDAEHAGT